MAFITVKNTIQAPISHVWTCWTKEEHITKWNFASDDWCCPSAKNDFQIGSEFHYEMASKDGSMSFDFWGTYTNIISEKTIEYTIGDGRKVQINFSETSEGTQIIEQFEPENQNPEEMQQAGWQSIVDNFKKHAESC
jgi:uncharacterized protein YndB with AHSA1/START domain